VLQLTALSYVLNPVKAVLTCYNCSNVYETISGPHWTTVPIISAFLASRHVFGPGPLVFPKYSHFNPIVAVPVKMDRRIEFTYRLFSAQCFYLKEQISGPRVVPCGTRGHETCRVAF